MQDCIPLDLLNLSQTKVLSAPEIKTKLPLTAVVKGDPRGYPGGKTNLFIKSPYCNITSKDFKKAKLDHN